MIESFYDFFDVLVDFLNDIVIGFLFGRFFEFGFIEKGNMWYVVCYVEKKWMFMILFNEVDCLFCVRISEVDLIFGGNVWIDDFIVFIYG